MGLCISGGYMKIKKIHLEYVGFAVPLLLALICLVSVTINHHQSFLSIPMPQELVGEYSRDGENWKPLTEDSDISAQNYLSSPLMKDRLFFCL